MSEGVGRRFDRRAIALVPTPVLKQDPIGTWDATGKRVPVNEVGAGCCQMSREENFAPDATSVFKIVLGVKVQEYVNPRPVPDRGMRSLVNIAVEFIFPISATKAF